MLKLAVIGKPVFHSRSPQIFNYLSSKNNIDLHYSRISSDSIDEAFQLAKQLKINGLNITSPFKKAIINIVDKLDYQATNLNAVNTVHFKDGMSIGYNTDYFGVLRTIWDNSLIFNKKKVLILGTGAAAQTAAVAIRNLNAQVSIWNHNESKIEKVAFEQGISPIFKKDLVKNSDKFDFIISTIPYNSSILKELKFNKNQVIVDSIYHNSFFEQQQKKIGFRVINGEKWLLNQALLAFEHFTSIKTELCQDVESVFEKQNNLNNKLFFLIGFSGSGKTKIGEESAKRLGYDFVDLDFEIQKNENKTISQIFENSGENYFRRLEKDMLSKYIQILNKNEKKVIISTGGGILSDADNFDLIRNSGKAIWIYSDFETCLNRIKSQDEPQRPILKDKNTAKDLFEKRIHDYFQISDFIFINNKDLENSISRLVSEFEHLF